MITQLEIKNFRGFSEYKIDDVGQVNLLVGTNNCGKTSILEAVHLLKSRGDVSILDSITAERRGEELESTSPPDQTTESDIRRLFHGFEFNCGSQFSIHSIGSDEENVSVELQEIDRYRSGPPQIHPENNQIRISWNSGTLDSHQDYPLSETGGLSYRYTRRHYKKTDNYVVESVPPASLPARKAVALFDTIVLTPDEDLLIDAVRIVEPDIERLASIKFSDDYISRAGIIVKSRKWKERVSIGNFGDGIWRLLGIALALVRAKNGTLLIDEIDTGLHHTVMSKMWKLICTTARKLNVQVFATTHSSDCWKTLADNAVEEEFADMPIRIHRINKNKESAVTFTNREMHLALDREIEVR